MGILALIPLSVVREVCQNVKRDKKSFIGEIKNRKRKNDRSTSSIEKINDVKRLLLSNGGTTKGKKKQKGPGKSERKVASKPRTHSKSDKESELGSSSESGVSDSSESESESTSGESEVDGNADKSDNNQGHSE